MQKRFCDYIIAFLSDINKRVVLNRSLCVVEIFDACYTLAQIHPNNPFSGRYFFDCFAIFDKK